MREQSEANETARQRLIALTRTLTEADCARPVGPDWTVASALAHLAFWDRMSLGRWRLALRLGELRPVDLAPSLPDLLNDGLLAEWLAVPGPAAAELAIAAATELDTLIAGLSDESVQAAIDAGHVRQISRSRHRNEHLDEIENALG